MSDFFLRIIPKDPKYIPSFDKREKSLIILKRFFNQSQLIKEEIFAEVNFIDQGENFEQVK